MVPPSLPRLPEDRRPERPLPEPDPARLPALPRPHRSPATGPSLPAPDSAGPPHPAPYVPDHPRPAAGGAERPHLPPVPAAGSRPPGGERPGRLPGPDGSGRLAFGASSPGSASFDLPAVPVAVGTARRLVLDLLTALDVPGQVRDDVILVTSELVTNALVHAAGERIACRLHRTADRVRIEVEDQDGGPGLPVVGRPGPDEQHGRGLFLVEALSSDWGVTAVPDRPACVVWAELPMLHHP
ncbi:Anti-sigma regulatory factor (Ser/Thr protein kinase) [Streptomyces sp. 1222.5]|nr:anti-sigma regulatory factor (Ser/Thr protein kinase) [Streptomyces sp. 5112.2]SEB71164.1 Anti-sigma regulatory factor (Ser/Thr protein kinase) [Streptomyces sp. 1222.5]